MQERKHVCDHPTLESRDDSPTRTGARRRVATPSPTTTGPRGQTQRAAVGPPPGVAGAPRRTLFFFVAAAAALIGFGTGRLWSPPTTRGADAPGGAHPSPPLSPHECPAPQSALTPSPTGVSAPVAGSSPAAPVTVAAPTATAGLAGSSAHVAPRLHGVRTRKAAQPAQPSPSAVTIPTPPSTATTPARDLENVTRELAAAF